MRSGYDDLFFLGLATLTRQSAERIVPIVVELLRPSSVVDVGCGTGTWLAVFAEHGVSNVRGLDGSYITSDLLEIPQDRFTAIELARRLDIRESYNLAVCLEVAEHLSPGAGPGLVEDLVELAPAVLFSAAIPYQDGVNHRNLQWPDYWANLFSSHGYRAIDCIRLRVWNDPSVACWYAQNTILYVDDSVSVALPSEVPARLVHPDVYLDKAARALTARELLERAAISLRHAVVSVARRVLGRGKRR